MFVALSKNLSMRFLIFLLLLCSTTVYSFDYKKAIRTELSKQFGNAANEQSILFDYNHFVKIKGDTFVVPNGYHYVFQLKNGMIQRMDECTFHGGNFGRFLFTWNNTIYALGGYGFFNTNNNLAYFNAKLKGWMVEKTTGNKPPFIYGVSYQLGDKIISFNNYKIGNYIDKDILDSNLYVMDLKHKQWIKKRLNPKVCFVGRVFYLKDYVLTLGNNHSVLVHRKGLQFVFVDNEKVGLNVKYDQINQINDNTMGILSYGNHRKEALQVLISMDELWSKSPKQALIVATTLTKHSTVIGTWMGLIISVLLVVISIYFFRKKKTKKAVLDYNALEQKLISEKRMLNTEELDAVFGIEHMDLDSKKFKRNRMINEMNLRHPDFITREKDDTDKRRYLYQIKN